MPPNTSDPTDHPVANIPLQPTHTLLIQQSTSFYGTSNVLEIPQALLPEYSPTDGLSPSYLSAALNNAKEKPSELANVYSLKKENMLATRVSVRNKDNALEAEWKSPILAMGTTSVTFPKQKGDTEEERRHELEVRPVGWDRRAQGFVKNSILYLWEVEKHQSNHKILYKVLNGQKIELGRYSQKTGYANSGILVVNADEKTENGLDLLTACVTCVVVLEAKESFGKYGGWK